MSTTTTPKEGDWLDELITPGMDSEEREAAKQAIRIHLTELERKARVNELEILKQTDAKDPDHDLDIPSYLEWRLAALTPPTTSSGEAES